MKLSILIATLPESYSINMLKRLNNILDPQIERYPGQVEKVINDAPRSMPTGTKRNHLIKDSDSDYFCFIDCDDVVHPYYVSEIMKAIEQDPDVITFRGIMTTNGKHPAKFIIKLGSEYVERGGVYYRFPNHLCVFKRSLVEHIKFPDLWVQEDYLYAKQIHDRKLLKNEIHLETEMYTYEFVEHKPNSYAKKNPIR